MAHENSIIGNTCLYGATGGNFFAAGRAGERFAVRNSGAVAVVEGAGDHCCEYMTGGKVVVLGRTGKNFAAGMTGGVAYALDLEGRFEANLNHELVVPERVVEDEDAVFLKGLIYMPLEKTDSQRAREILADWNTFQAKFWKIKPTQPVAKAPALALAPVQEEVAAKK